MDDLEQRRLRAAGYTGPITVEGFTNALPAVLDNMILTISRDANMFWHAAYTRGLTVGPEETGWTMFFAVSRLWLRLQDDGSASPDVMR